MLDEIRLKQPISELERKWNKAKGRHSNAFWCVEWINLARARGRELGRIMRSLLDEPPKA